MRSFVRGLSVSKRGVDASKNQRLRHFRTVFGVPGVAQLLHF
jgi:hypothetical protein